jgi:hypothetical protein
MTEEKKQDALTKQRKLKGGGIFLIILLVVFGYFLIKNCMGGVKLSDYITPSETSAPSPAYTPPPATPASHFTLKVNKFNVGEYDNYEVIGEIKNIDTVPFYFVSLKAEFLNKAGEVVGEDSTYACGTDYILPNGTKSFKFMGTNQSDYKSVRVRVESCSEVR